MSKYLIKRVITAKLISLATDETDELAKREAWLLSCIALGGERSALEQLDADAAAYAPTQLGSNDETISIIRTTAREELISGRPLPVSAEHAMNLHRRQVLLWMFANLHPPKRPTL